MVEAQSWTTRRSSNPRLETSVDIPSTPTGEVRYGTTNNIFASFSATSFVSPTILTALIIASWYLSNIGVLLLNKYLLSFYGYKYPIFLTMLHMISCTFYSLIAIRWFQIVPFQQILSRKQFLKIFALSGIFCFSVVCGNTSLRYLPVSFNQAIGATTPFFTAIFAFLITCKKESAGVYLALMPVVFGIVLASNSEPLFHLFGFLMCVGSTAGRALKSVVQGLLLTSDSEKLHSMNLLLYMAPMAAMILLPFTLYIEGNVFARLGIISESHNFERYLPYLCTVRSEMSENFLPNVLSENYYSFKHHRIHLNIPTLKRPKNFATINTRHVTSHRRLWQRGPNLISVWSHSVFFWPRSAREKSLKPPIAQLKR